MHTIKREALVPYSQKQMFTLINTVGAYPEFVPGCVKGEICEEQANRRVARLTFSVKGLTHSFTTENTLHPYDAIQLRWVSGIFSQLGGQWLFTTLPTTGTHVSLSLTFSLSQSWVNQCLEPLFVQLADQLVPIFCERADHIYSNPSKAHT